MAYCGGRGYCGRLYYYCVKEKAVLVRRYYYWIVSKDPETGKPYLIFGSDKDEATARQKGLEMLGGVDFEIKRYPTRDLATASAYLRGKRLEQSGSLGVAGKRIGHDRSLRRMRRKQGMPNW